jgi:hypothetical protein
MVNSLDVRTGSMTQALLSISQTVFICLILGLGAMLFSRDAHNLVLLPIERMIKKVRDMSENPLQKQGNLLDDGVGKQDSEQFETKILENAFSKICSLMAVGFGEAGAQIITENLKNKGELDAMVSKFYYEFYFIILFILFYIIITYLNFIIIYLLN